MKKHNYIIDMLRFFAAFIVVLFHLNLFVPYVDNWYRNLVKYGWLGVPVFFVISGYCIMLSASTSSGSLNFLTKRFFRIYPAYWLSLVIVLGAALFQKTYTGTNSVANIPVTVPHIIANITLFTWPVSNIKISNFVYWTLTCEVIFYLIIGITQLFKSTYLKQAFLVAISLISLLLPYQHEGYLFFFDEWPSFGLGISLYYLFYKKNNADWVCASLLLIINTYAMVNKNMALHQIEYIIVAAFTFLAIAGSHFIKSSKNIFSVLGEHSYAVYLIHVPIGFFVLGYLKTDYILRHPFITLFYDVVIYSIISIIAWQVFRFIEKPSMNFGKKLASKYFSNQLKTKTATI
jgi:peptidoglycan/LPS O-acetylase OafA/YrhL